MERKASGVPRYVAEFEGEGPARDIVVVLPDRRWRLGGRSGAEREAAAAKNLLDALARDGGLPVFVGTGLGMGLSRFLDAWSGPVAVVDREEPILALTGCRKRLEGRENVLWLDQPTAEEVLSRLTRWQLGHGGGRFVPLASPVYQRLDREYYGSVAQGLAASREVDFWSRARSPRFTGSVPRILLLTSRYFLMGEVTAACDRLGIPHLLIDIGSQKTGRTEFVEKILQAVVSFRPDFILTINHLGVDREGVLVELLEHLNLPLASWFVDNPHLILYCFRKVVSPCTAIFTWDEDTVPTLKAMGFSHVFYLPLGTDTTRFSPRPRFADGHPWRSDVAFVGNSMLYKVGGRLKDAAPPRELAIAYRSLARGFGESGERSVSAYLASARPDLLPLFKSMETERRLDYETLVTWESTRVYRASCVREILPFSPLIAGDPGWRHMLRSEPASWRWHPELNYYEDLPRFYPQADINFNCTSMQMKGAVNQRVFDVPACGAFLLTDHRRQMDSLFEPGREVACFRDVSEIAGLVRHYQHAGEDRSRIAAAGRRRVLAEHSYDRRVTDLCRMMRESFA